MRNTEKMASYLKGYNSEYVLNNDFKYRDEYAYKLLIDSVTFCNSYYFVFHKDRSDIEKTAKEIINLSLLPNGKKVSLTKVLIKILIGRDRV